MESINLQLLLTDCSQRLITSESFPCSPCFNSHTASCSLIVQYFEASTDSRQIPSDSPPYYILPMLLCHSVLFLGFIDGRNEDRECLEVNRGTDDPVGEAAALSNGGGIFLAQTQNSRCRSEPTKSLSQE